MKVAVLALAVVGLAACGNTNDKKDTKNNESNTEVVDKDKDETMDEVKPDDDLSEEELDSIN